jgi:predicted flap endonuclease-1-like 5' DNA nuclease
VRLIQTCVVDSIDQEAHGMTAIMEVEGIGAEFARKLKDAGIDTVEELLREGATPGGRSSIARRAGVDESRVLEWVNRADLMRVKGVGSEFSDLLEAAGVDTVRELAQRNAQNLYAKLTEVNEAKRLVRRVPSPGEVEDWVRQAARAKPAFPTRMALRLSQERNVRPDCCDARR